MQVIAVASGGAAGCAGRDLFSVGTIYLSPPTHKHRHTHTALILLLLEGCGADRGSRCLV